MIEEGKVIMMEWNDGPDGEQQFVSGDITVSMLSTLAPTSWRAVVKWRDDVDIDAQVLFGRQDSCEATFRTPETLHCPDTNGLAAFHEIESSKQGPETVRLDNVGECDALTGACTIHFYVEDTSGDSLSEVTVQVYHGSEKAATYDAPGGEKETTRWGVFTLDAQKDAQTVLYTGIKAMCPYILQTGEANWGTSLDMEGWST